MATRCDNFGGSERNNKLINGIEYWRCGDFANTYLALLNSAVADRCDNHATSTCKTNSRGKTEGWTYLQTSHATGYRNKDNSRKYNTEDAVSETIILDSWIQHLYSGIVNEINSRKANYLYKNCTKETLDACPAVGDVIYAKTLNDLKSAMQKMNSGLYNDVNANLRYTGLMIDSKTMFTGHIIYANEAQKYIEDLNNAYKDCICYSDCGSYAICYCYGNCNFY